jgi:hypothetical protein
MLETLYEGNDNGVQYTGDRPINLNGAQILDTEREDGVFLPGKGEKGYNLSWINDEGSLQGSKIILLDGKVPVLQSVIPGGKGNYEPDNKTGNSNATPPITSKERWYYFNRNDTIEFEIRANKPIRNIGQPKIAFNIQASDGATTGPYSAEYVRPTDNGLLFAIDARNIPGANGFITGLSLTADANNKIVDLSGGNELSSNPTLNSSYNSLNYIVVVDDVTPPVTAPRLGGGVPVTYYGAAPILTLTGRATSAQEPWGSFAQYSLDGGLTWENYPSYRTNSGGQHSFDNGLAWHNGLPAATSWVSFEVSGSVLNVRVKPGQWNLVTRQIDKAGNESALSPVYYIEVEDKFPKLLSIDTSQPKGVYKSGDTLEFILDFERPVYTTNGNAYIIVSDRNANTTDDTQISAVRVPVTQQGSGAAKTKLSFTWNLASNSKNMPYGITVTRIYLNGVQDVYGNLGSTLGTVNTPNLYPGTPGTNQIQTGNDVKNLNGEQIKVLTYKPTLVELESIPRSGHVSGNADANGLALNSAIVMTDRDVIKLKFSHEIRKEIGKLYIKPYGTYPIPPVFPSIGYTDADGTYNEGFLEVLNSGNIDAYAAAHNNNPNAATLRNYLYATGFVNTAGGILTNATGSVTDDKGKLLTTGQDFGPYKLTTQGLAIGDGYRADGSGTPNALYTDNGASAGWNPVSTGTGTGDTRFMIPDTSSKYVLDYAHANNATTTQVTNIRTALNAAKYRWREIDVNSSSVKIYKNDFGNMPVSMGMYVEIQLDTALAKGFRWEVQWEEGVFVDEAGNSAASYGYDLSAGTREHWFWTEGVQPPVIRVNRNSLDWRTAADRRGLDGKPPSAAVPSTASGGTHYRSFDTVSFKIESETPGAQIRYASLLGQAQSGTIGKHAYGAIQAAWTGNIGTGLMAWTANAVGDDTTGTWILPNLLRRANRGHTGGVVNDVRQTTSGLAYDVTRNGSTSRINGQGSYRGFRSYNRDATVAQLEELAAAAAETSASTGSVTGSVQLSESTADTASSLRASKNYIAAQARITNAGATHNAVGYEGVFKTVVVLSTPFSGNDKVFSNTNGQAPQIIFGCNNIGSSSIAGFPLLSASTDQRFLRCVYSDHANQFLWISTEIVSSLYVSFLSSQNNGDLKACPFNAAGDTGTFVSGSYGDLTYSYNQDMPF